MRRKTILLAWLPLTNAISLANFQDITSILVPLSCLFEYDSQIPSCAVSDFGDAGCSSNCQSSLLSVAQDVSSACSSVTVNSNTLLGIIKNGGILQALCPTLQKTTSTIQKASTTAIQQTTLQTTGTNSVTLATTSSATTSRSTSTSTAQSAASTPSSKSKSSATKSSTSQTVESTTVTTSGTTSATTEASTSSEAAVAATTTTSTSKTKTTSSATTSTTSATGQQANQQGGSGGGSPFDISSNGAAGRVGGSSILALLIAVGAGMMLGR